MNLLKKVIISGEINSMYASVSFQYIFANSGKDMANNFYMAIPENSCITGFSVLNQEKCLVKGEFAGISHAETDDAVKLIMTDWGLCCFNWDEIQDMTEYIFSVDMIIRMCPRNKVARLHIPLGINLSGAEAVESNTCPFEMNLYTRLDNITIKSSTYPVKTTYSEKETMFSVQGNTGKDLTIDFNMNENSSFGTVGEYMGEGTGLYRIYTKDRKVYTTPKKNILFLLDLENIIAEGKRKAVKELLFRLIQKIPKELLVQVLTTDTENSRLLDKFMPSNMQTQDEVYDKLSKVSYIDNSFENMFEKAEILASPDTEIVLVSGGDGTRKKESILKSKIQRAHIFTVGDFADSDFTKFWKRNIYGVHEHFHSNDMTEERYCEAVRRVLETGCDVQVQAEDSAAREILVLKGTDMASDGYIDVAVKYTGIRPRKFLILKDNDEIEICKVADIDTYQAFPDAERLFGAEKTERLYGLLNRTAPVSVRNIKKQLEILGTESGIVNSETAICLNGKRGNRVIVHEMYSSVTDGIYEFASRPAMFRQKGELNMGDKERQAVIRICTEHLLNNIRKDGAVTDRLSEKDRVEDSVYSLAAFMLAQDKELSPVIADIMEYIKDKKITYSAEILYKNIHDIKGFLRKYGEDFFKNTPTLKELAKSREVKAVALIILKMEL